LGKLRAFERDVLRALESVASDVAQFLSPRTEDENVRRTWTVTFATLGAEASDAAARLADAGNLRMVMLLVRSLYEYTNKATYYANRLGEAREDARKGWKFRERMLEVALSDFLPTVEPLSAETKVKTTPVSNVVDAVAAPATGKGTDAGLLYTLVRLSPTAHDADVDALLNRWKAFDAPLLAFKNRYIAEAGFEQAALDCLGT